MSDAKNQNKVGNRPKLSKLDTTMANPVNQSKDANKPKLPKLDTKMVKPIDQIKEEAASTNPTKSSTRSATSDPSLRVMQSQENLARRSTETSKENKPGKSDSHHSKRHTNADSSEERSASTADATRAANGSRIQDANSHTTTRSHSEKPRQTTTDVAKKGGQPSDSSKDSLNPVGRENDRKVGSQQPKTESRSTEEMHYAEPVDYASASETSLKHAQLVNDISKLQGDYWVLNASVHQISHNAEALSETVNRELECIAKAMENLFGTIKTSQEEQRVFTSTVTDGFRQMNKARAPQHQGYQQMPPPDPYAGYSDQWVCRPENRRYK
ncbi:hypothetical protein LTR37_017809 [Vermiconidia calcicola]|uniref:Uncharacterized protein n=1 Tax=Vermiconidia calcicola TaxID=1690605 RepID=A0ACC3MJ62_9PEZI|nr:hypothetical protein LTR37_017809 [Vermiconidia calcicola]